MLQSKHNMGSRSLPDSKIMECLLLVFTALAYWRRMMVMVKGLLLLDLRTKSLDPRVDKGVSFQGDEAHWIASLAFLVLLPQRHSFEHDGWWVRWMWCVWMAALESLQWKPRMNGFHWEVSGLETMSNNDHQGPCRVKWHQIQVQHPWNDHVIVADNRQRQLLVHRYAAGSWRAREVALTTVIYPGALFAAQDSWNRDDSKVRIARLQRKCAICRMQCGNCWLDAWTRSLEVNHRKLPRWIRL